MMSAKKDDLLQASPRSPSARLRLHVQGAGGVRQTLEFGDITESDAVRRTVARGWRILAIESAVVKATDDSGRGVRFPLLLFSQELLALLDAGLNLTEALATLHAKERTPATRATLGDILRLLQEGRSFSDVLALMPQHFPEVYIATVRASERTGDLSHALGRYIAYQLQFEGIRKKLISAAIYPAMLLVVGGFVTLFLLGYVVPKFSAVYESSGRELPWLSELLLAFGKIIYGNWPVALLCLLVLVGGVLALVGHPAGRGWLLDRCLRLPWLAAKADEFRLARFYRAVSLLLSSGIALPRALGMVSGLLSDAQQVRLIACRQAVEEGQSLSFALNAEELSSPVAESLIKVGERSGQLAEMLERTARFVDDDFARWVDWASRMLEPILMTLIGLVIGTVVILMYMPIFDLAGSLQ